MTLLFKLTLKNLTIYGLPSDTCVYNCRMFLPTLEEYFQDAIEQNDPEQQIEEEYK